MKRYLMHKQNFKIIDYAPNRQFDKWIIYEIIKTVMNFLTCNKKALNAHETIYY
jgi:hypothetical protein